MNVKIKRLSPTYEQTHVGESLFKFGILIYKVTSLINEIIVSTPLESPETRIDSM